jgi:hypothetical protein
MILHFSFLLSYNNFNGVTASGGKNAPKNLQTKNHSLVSSFQIVKEMVCWKKACVKLHLVR